MRNLAQQTNSDLMLCLGNTTNRYTYPCNLALFTNEWGFFMATTPRKTQTPGAKKETLATAQPSADDVLDSVLGKPDAPAETPEQPKTAEDVLVDILNGDDLGKGDTPEGFISLERFDVVAKDLTETQEQLATAQGELTSFKNDVSAMLTRVAELQGKPQPVIANTAVTPTKKRMKSVLGPKGWTMVED